jgi:hypothetical protein
MPYPIVKDNHAKTIPSRYYPTEAIMAQAISLGDMLKAKLAEKQQPIQLRLFDDKYYIEYEVNRVMDLSITELHTLHDVNPDAYYRARVIRDATNKLRYAEKQWAKEISRILELTD